MKKVIFSAIALLAFTATSFAAEGKKEVKKAEVKTEVKVSIIISDTPCFDQYLKDKAVLEDVLPCDDAQRGAEALFNQCLKDTYGG